MKVKSLKILDVMTIMISLPNSITGVIRRGEFYYFMTDAIHLWFIKSNRNETQLHLMLSSSEQLMWKNIDLKCNNGEYFVFSSLDYETSLFDELYDIIQSKVNGLEHTLNQSTKINRNEN